MSACFRQNQCFIPTSSTTFCFSHHFAFVLQWKEKENTKSWLMNFIKCYLVNLDEKCRRGFLLFFFVLSSAFLLEIFLMSLFCFNKISSSLISLTQISIWIFQWLVLLGFLWFLHLFWFWLFFFFFFFFFPKVPLLILEQVTHSEIKNWKKGIQDFPSRWTWLTFVIILLFSQHPPPILIPLFLNF